MRKILQSFTLLLVAFCLFGGLPTARASHLLGCDMTYTSLGNNQYRVKFRLYRDCSGITASGFTLSCRNGGCNAPVTVSAPLVQQGNIVAATPLCPSNPATCASPSGSYPLYDFANYEATVTLPPGQWTLSTSQGSRPDIGNLVSANTADLYAEAFLDNRNNVLNTSPQFDPQDIPIQYVCVNQLTTFGFSAIEPDGDSLTYSLARPLRGCGLDIPYKPYPGAQSGAAIITRNPLCIVEFLTLAGGNNYTPLLPLPVTIDTTGTCPIKQGTPAFRLNQSARTVTFRPNRYVPNVAAGDGDNKYQVVIEVEEKRLVNGAWRVIGRVRREAVLIVIDCGNNTTPAVPTATSQTQNSNTATINRVDTTQINVYSCNYSRVVINFTDPDNLKTPSAHQRLTVTLPANINTDPNYLASGDIGTFGFSTNVNFANGSENPQATFIFQPSPTAVGRTIRIPVHIEDNACPVKGLQNRVIVIKVLRGNFATAVALAGGQNLPGVTPVTLCSGPLSLRGTVSRPDSVRNIANNTTRLQTYSYNWELVSGNGFNTATADNQNITVTPTVTSRYRLRITPNSGFGPGCGDETIVTVRVAPPVVSRFTITDSISSRPATNSGLPGGTLIPPITYRFNNASTIAGIPGQTYNATATEFRLDSVKWTVQRVKDAQGRPLTGEPVRVFSRLFTPLPTSLVLFDGGTYLIKLSSAATLITSGNATRGQCPESVFQRLVVVPELRVPNIITPNNDNLNDVFVVPVSQRGGKLEIYNRWGTKVKEYSSYQNNWGGEGQPDGTYYYFLTDTSGNKTKGWVEVRHAQ